MTQNIPLRLKELRTRAGLTQSRLAKMANVSKAAISAYENGLRQPSYDTLVRLAAILHVSTDYLLGITNERVLDVSRLTEDDISVVQSVVDAFTKKNARIRRQSKDESSG